MIDKRKTAAIILRRQGYSINQVADALKAAKSSVSIWTRDVQLTDEQLTKLRASSHSPAAIEKRRNARIASETKKRDNLINQAFAEVGNISPRELWLIGTSLYWAEGGKTQRTVRFSNGDPEMIRLMIRHFKESCAVANNKLRGYIHIHDSLDHVAAETYWSKVSGIPVSSFYKTYRKPNPSGKGLRQTLPFGVFDIYVADVTLFLKIQGWIKALHLQK